MKYIIELTDKQRKRFKNMNSALIKMGMGFDILSLLEPIKTTNVEDTNEYDRGYTQAIADYRKFERFFHSEGIEAFEDIRNTDGTISIDMILQYLPIPEIMARIKAYEEKKKAEEEIKVGDEIVCNCPNEQRVIITAICDGWVTFMRKDGACYSRADKDLKKTGRHFDEIEQLLHELRGEE